MIRMISGTTRIGKRTYTPVDGCFEATPEVEERLVALGVATYAPEHSTAVVATPPADTNVCMAGDNSDQPKEGAEDEEAGHLDPEQLKELTCDKLRELAEEMGISTSKLKTKAQLIEAISSVDVIPGAEEPLPAIEAEGPVE